MKTRCEAEASGQWAVGSKVKLPTDTVWLSMAIKNGAVQTQGLQPLGLKWRTRGTPHPNPLLQRGEGE
jgi:hypothetical protein